MYAKTICYYFNKDLAEIKQFTGDVIKYYKEFCLSTYENLRCFSMDTFGQFTYNCHPQLFEQNRRNPVWTRTLIVVQGCRAHYSNIHFIAFQLSSTIINGLIALLK